MAEALPGEPIGTTGPEPPPVITPPLPGGPEPIIPSAGGTGGGGAGASYDALHQSIVTALNTMAQNQYGSANPLSQFAGDLAKAISDYCRSLTVRPEKFKIMSSTVATVGSSTNQVGPQGDVPLLSDSVSLGEMNPSA